MLLGCSPPRLCRLAAVTWAASFLAAHGQLLKDFSAYRVRLLQGSELPEQPFVPGADSGAWTVDEVQFFSDITCEDPHLSVVKFWASVGSEASVIRAFDGNLDTSWRAECQEGVDSANGCKDSWENGAWIGAELATPATLRCMTIVHDGAPEGLVVQGWDGSTWRPLQIFGLVPESPEAGRVRLRLPASAACGADVPPIPAESEDTWLPSCLPDTQWRLRAPSTAVVWTVAELKVFSDEGCTEQVEGGTAIGGNPAPTPDEPNTWAHMTDEKALTAWSVPVDASESWVCLAFNRSVSIKCVSILHSFEPFSISFTSSLESWDGEAWVERESIKAQTGDYLTTQYLPEKKSDDGSAWRLVNDGLITKAWAVTDVAFYSDVDCEERLQGGTPLSNDSPGRGAVELPKAFDRRANTAWVSPCMPCAAGVAYIGQSFQAAVVVRCVALRQSEDLEYRPDRVRMELWTQEAGWKQVATFDGLLGGLQLLSPDWGRAQTRFVITNSGLVTAGWRIAELRLFRDLECSSRVRGVGMSVDGNNADAERAFDGNLDTFWHADCCSLNAELRIGACFGCQAEEAWLGIMLARNDTIECIQLIQKGEAQARGDPHYAAGELALLQWDGEKFAKLYNWDNVPPAEWVELGVGRARSEIGSALGCKDDDQWNRCNETDWNCSRYEMEGLCNETYQDETDCEGMTMALSCKASCCLCGASNPEKCDDGSGGGDELPEWVIPSVGGVGGLFLLCGLTGCCCCWRKRTCHETKVCGRCCHCLDVCCRRKEH